MRKSLLLSLISLLAIANVWAQGVSESTESATLINGFYYVLHSGTKTASVTNSNPGYTSTEQTYSGDIVVPAKVKHGSINYTVTEIGDFAFESQYEVKSVDIPATVTKIGMMALYKNVELSSITCRAVVPPATSTEAESFDFGICYEVPLYVPAESVEAYKTAETWKLFRNILPIGTKIVNVSDMWYMLNTDHTATFVAPLKYAYYEGEFTIPATVNYVSTDDNAETKSESKEYKVTSIGDKALADQSGIVSVTLPETIESLGSAIFENCTRLTKITCKSATPPAAISGTGTQETLASLAATKANATATFDDQCFNNVQLYVPMGSLEAYKSTAPWSNFKSIVGVNISGITNIANDDMSISISGCNLYADGKYIQIYDTTGRIIYDGNTEVTLQRGIYIVKVGNRSLKVKI